MEDSKSNQLLESFVAWVKRVFSLEMLIAAIGVVSFVVMTHGIIVDRTSVITVAVSGTTLALSLICLLWLYMDPESIRARNTADVLTLADQMYKHMENGLTLESAQAICDLLLSATVGVAVAITDRETVLGYSGFEEVHNPTGKSITTNATHEVIETGEILVCHTPAELGFPFQPRRIRAGIIIPLFQGRDVVGTLKFYYRNSINITETQMSMAQGFGMLLSTQIAAKALEEQTKLVTSMELQALQAQINPHFLFNTINTISSFIRMDPNKARTLLREFAAFYRQSLEETGDLVALSRELEQTQRYFHFEEARFGEDRVRLEVEVEDDIADMLVPAFLVQPLVENAVRHGRPAEGLLTIRISAELRGTYLILSVRDDGVGMTEERRAALEKAASKSSSSTGLGIAMKNVHDRVEGYFGVGSRMAVESALGEGTCVSLHMNLDSDKLEAFTKAKAEKSKTASAEAISAGEVRSMAEVAEKSKSTGFKDEISQALSGLQ